MRPEFVIRALVGALIALLISLANSYGVANAADEEPPSCPAGTVPTPGEAGWICIPATDPGDPGDPGDEDPGDGGTTPGSTACRDASGAEIPCTNEFGTWSSAHQCYAAPMVPQPAADQTEYWEGNDPATGTVWVCVDAGVAIPPMTSPCSDGGFSETAATG